MTMINQFQKEILDSLGILYKNFLIQRKNKVEVFLGDFPEGGIRPETFFDTIIAIKKDGFDIDEYDRDEVREKCQVRGKRNTACCEVTLPDNFEDLYKQMSEGVQVPASEKISLTGKAATFDDNEPKIVIGGKPCPLPPYKNEHYLCRVMFSHPVGEAVDWSIAYEKMTESEVLSDKQNLRTVQDAMYAVNSRIKEVLNTDDELFTWQNKTIKRNF